MLQNISLQRVHRSWFFLRDEEIYGRYLDMVRENVLDYYTLLYSEKEQCTSIVKGYFEEI